MTQNVCAAKDCGQPATHRAELVIYAAVARLHPPAIGAIQLCVCQTHADEEHARALPAPGAPASSPLRPIDGAYALLHVRSNAPIEVCEAAYRALTKVFHPDITGSTAVQQSLNGAIEMIRKERAK